MIADLKPYPIMKDSGVPWLGQVPEHWEVTPIARIGQLFKGRGGSKEDEETSGVPCVRYGDLYTRHEFFINSTKAFVSPDRASAYTPIRYGDVLFAASGETMEDIGRSAVNLLDGDAVCGGDVILLRPGRDMNPRLLGYAADAPSSRHQKATMGRGYTIVHIYESELKRLALAIPPLAEQVAIVRFLDRADIRIRRYITAKQKLIKLLEEERQVITERAVMRGPDPMVRLKPSGIDWVDDVPANWEVTPLGRLIDLLTGFPFKSDGFTQVEGDVRLLRGVNISPGRLRWIDVVRWPKADRVSYGAFELHRGDIVLGMDRPLIQGGTRVARVEEADIPALLLQRVARIRTKDTLSAEFLILLLAGKSFSDYLTPIFTGVSVPHLSPDQIKAFRFGLPSIEEQREIVHRVAETTRAINLAIATAEREIALLREYRTRLIADVVTGKLDVRKAAAKLPEVTPEAASLDEIDDMSQDEESAQIEGA